MENPENSGNLQQTVPSMSLGRPKGQNFARRAQARAEAYGSNADGR